MKYVLTDKDEFAIGRGNYHRDLASGFAGRVIAAGYCRIEDGRVTVYGKSRGFKLEAQPEDAAHLEKLLSMPDADTGEA
jgi:hypothetical protein